MSDVALLTRQLVAEKQQLALDHILHVPGDQVDGQFGELPGGVWRYGLTVNL